jgi:FAD:protein FMN transferase
VKTIYKTALVLLALLFCLPILTGCKGETLGRFEETRELMDTYVRVVIYAKEETAQEAINAAFTRIEEIEAIATSWDVEGEAYKLNETGYLENPSDEILELLNLSLEYNEITEGYFDVTVQPLLDLWSYNPTAEKQFWELDKDTQQTRINEAKGLIGSDKIIIKDGTVRLKEGSTITLGGIAKGYADDEALKVLSKMGIKHAFIDAGGDICTMNSKPDGEPWGIALVNPDDTTQFLASFAVSDMAVTTSGNYERYFNPEKTVHHIMNPKTGFSAGECISVTIIAKTGTVADILATGVFVMGPEKGMQLVESLDDVEALIVDSNRNIHKSSGLSKYLIEE